MTTPGIVERLRNIFAMSEDEQRRTRDEAADLIERAGRMMEKVEDKADWNAMPSCPECHGPVMNRTDGKARSRYVIHKATCELAALILAIKGADHRPPHGPTDDEGTQ